MSEYVTPSVGFASKDTFAALIGLVKYLLRKRFKTKDECHFSNISPEDLLKTPPVEFQCALYSATSSRRTSRDQRRTSRDCVGQPIKLDLKREDNLPKYEDIVSALSNWHSLPTLNENEHESEEPPPPSYAHLLHPA